MELIEFLVVITAFLSIVVTVVTAVVLYRVNKRGD